MDKSPDAFRTISEVADWLGVQTHVLRFWESKFSQVKPVKRAGGRRYYRPSDMALLGGIKKLLHDDGVTIKGVQKMLREQGVQHISSFSQPLDLHAEIEAETIEVYPEDLLGENVVPFQTRPEDGGADGASQETPKAETTALSEPESPVAASVQDSEPAGDAPPLSEAAAEPEASPLPAFLTHPMGGNESPKPAKPRQVEAPDPPMEDDIAVTPGTLYHLRGVKALDSETARAMAPLIGRLAVLRDRLAGSAG